MAGPLESLRTALADRYRIERELGAGGMATVYLAHDLKHDRDLALKVLRPELCALLGAERFLREIQLTAKLQHPHILPLLDSGEAAGLFFYVMPYVEGESLRQRMEREKQLPIEDALRLTTEVAEALDYAHQQGVIHRDIKPENILLSRGHALVADFGIALAVTQAGRGRLTETGLSLGTPAYMSPEQAMAEPDLDGRTDQYSLASVLYEMLAGEPPYTGPTAQAVVAKRLREPVPRLGTVREVPPAVERAVTKALAKSRADRFVSVGAFAAALSAGGGVRLTPAWRSRLAALVVAAALLALGGLGWSLLGRGHPQPDIPLDRVQLTSTGNASTPALSPDGMRVAYQTRECDADGRCTASVVIQDVAGSGQLTVLRRVPLINGFMWTNDGRYLAFYSWSGGRRRGAHIVSTLGGEPRFLGCCGGTVGAADTVIVAAQPDGAGPGVLRFVTAGDGTTRDSLLVPRDPGDVLWVRSSRDGRRLAVILGRPGHVVVRVTSRQGTVTDSLGPLSYEGLFTGLTPSGDALLVGLPHLSDWGAIDLVRYRIDQRGRLTRKPDTLLTQLSSAQWIDLSLPGGSLAYATGAARYSVWALRRPTATSMQFAGRRLLNSTSRVVALLSADGEQVGLSRLTVRDGRQMAGFAVIPFDSGPEVTAVAPSGDLFLGRWSREGSRGVLARGTADSQVVFQEGESAGDRVTPIGAIPERRFTDFFPLHGGGVAVLAPGGRQISRVGVPGRADTMFRLPDSLPSLQALGTAPDRLEVIGAGFDYAVGELCVLRLSLADGVTSRIASLPDPLADVLHWLPDGSFLVSVRETQQNEVWYRIRATGDTTRLGEPPHLPAAYSLSSDGLRAVAVAEERQTDIFLIHDFGRMLEH